ncbi:hypothetical protein CWATWH8502_906 [Crocosphaera watsonii WH 8502]|uniref:Uncharacterized protein n=5 Tax=Crocosphaera watsonii TaxID=263511 RepID=T2JWE7_CROWT|nr:hypothetical protein CWATWH0003_2494 [Crocosphaera watsonii WH 0003]CCQ51820.1 hypothetical protein CWATWH8502_906 [Crocosphaera watsonii WH 8502]CCQ57356.1 hypothetical protein CWATWH0005_1336 [Crocosphaera watsonii WH 0005]CCQ61295.1 hypothetical protein CWATWH0401_231 [Crocosphaera watsonii WH 0401]CCQ69540.1 hypothetical protein CWATWH0402_2431 [Crocosphaera watsonii WH 0402]
MVALFWLLELNYKLEKHPNFESCVIIHAKSNQAIQSTVVYPSV